MVIELIDDCNEWDDFVQASPNSLIFHRWKFLKIIEKYSSYEALPYGIYNHGELVSVFPVFHKNLHGLKMVYSPPRGSTLYIPYLGLVLNPAYGSLKQRKKENYLDKIVEEFDGALKALSPNYVSLEIVPTINDVRPFKYLGYTPMVHYTYYIDLKPPVEEIFNSFDRECKKHINNCAKEDLSLKEANDVDQFFAMMRARLARVGTTYFDVQNPQYIKDVIEAFPDNVKLYFLYRGSDVIGIKLNCEYNRHILSWMGAAKLQNDFNSNEYMIWELMKKGRSEGYTVYENWGAELKHLNQFKAKFNPELKLHFTLQKEDAVGRMASQCYGILTKQRIFKFLRSQ